MVNSMTFTQSFMSALKSYSKVSASCTPEVFMPSLYPNQNQIYPNYLSLLAGGKMTAAYPFYYDMERLDAYCILCTEEGSGYLLYEGRTFYLDPGSIAFFDCRKPFHIEIQHSPWEYKVLYIKGTPLLHYYDIFSPNMDVIFFTGKSSYLSELIDKIIHFDYTGDYYALIQNRKLTEFLTDLTTEKKHGILPYSEVKNHVSEMKYMFDSHYEFHYTLDWLEDYFKISRYRLCREFKKAEGLSPIAYLNSTRINAAKYLLINSQMRINEIAGSVGIENTNHFIELFKANTGTTPSKYRK